jgi:hypothetical protein
VAEEDKENGENLSGDILCPGRNCSRISQGSVTNYHGNSL